MPQMSPHLSPVVGFAGSVLGVVGGVIATSSADTSTGTAGLYVGAGGILMGAATLLGVMSEKLMPQLILLSRVWLENREENRKNREARHRLANELQAALAQMEALKLDAEEAKRKANDSENLAIEAVTRLEVVEKLTKDRLRAVAKGVRSNSERLDVVEAVTGSGDSVLPIPPEETNP